MGVFRAHQAVAVLPQAGGHQCAVPRVDESTSNELAGCGAETQKQGDSGSAGKVESRRVAVRAGASCTDLGTGKADIRQVCVWKLSSRERKPPRRAEIPNPESEALYQRWKHEAFGPSGSGKNGFKYRGSWAWINPPYECRPIDRVYEQWISVNSWLDSKIAATGSKPRDT